MMMMMKCEYVAFECIEGNTLTKGAKRPKIEGEARTMGEAQDKSGEMFGERGSVNPSLEFF